MEKIVSPITGKSKYLLIENCEFISDVKISNDLKESLKLSTGKAGTLIVKNLPGTILNRENQNGRIYSTEVLAQAIREARPLFETKQLLSQACEHPEGSFVSPTTASHVVTNAYIKKNVNVVVDGEPGRYDMLFMDIEVLNTDEGKNLRALLEAECSVGTSIRGVGDMEGKYVKNYEFLGIDFVGNPSSSTFTRMPVSESVKVEMKDPREMKETFTVSTSSTNVVRDLDQAAMLQQQLDGLGYGTVTKTSTKLDQETDPKTGAQTSIATLEAETSDDVADLDQALQMARNAMLNGTINVDSITIENIPEEDQTKESVEAACEYVPEKTTLKEKPVTEAKKEDEEDPNLGRKFVLKAGNRGFVTFDKNAIDFTNKPEDALHFTQGKEENGMVSLSKVTEILDAMGEFDVEKYFQTGNINLGGVQEPEAVEPETPATPIEEPTEECGTSCGESQMTEENGSNTKYIAQVTINDQNGSNNETISVSAVDLDSAKNEIANLYDMKSKGLSGEGTVNIILTDTTTGEQLHYNPESQLLESGENNTEEKAVCSKCEKEFPVKDMQAVNNSDEMLCPQCYDSQFDSNPFKEEYNEADFNDPVVCSWCKDMFEKSDCKKEKDMGWLCDQCQRALESRGVELDFEDETIEESNGDLICTLNSISIPMELLDAINNRDFDNPQTADALEKLYGDYTMGLLTRLEFLNKAIEILEDNMELSEDNKSDIQVDGNKLSIQLDKNTAIEKEVNNPMDAQIAKAGIDNGKIDPAFMVTEDFGGFTATQNDDGTTTYNCDTTATYDYKTGEFSCGEGTQKEKLYSNPSEPSDGYEKEPLEDATTEDFIVTLGNIDWNIDNVDPRFFSKIENLPDTCDIRVQGTTIDTADSSEELKAAILAGANETMYPFGINDGTVVSIKDAKTGEVLA